MSKFGKETHAYSVAYGDDEIDEVVENSDKIIFNSISQLNRFETQSAGKTRGLRVNPRVSSSEWLISDPARPHSRLGEWDAAKIEAGGRQDHRLHVPQQLRERRFRSVQSDARRRSRRNSAISSRSMEWVSLGGGIHFTGENYPLEKLCRPAEGLLRQIRRAGLSGAGRSLDHQVDNAGSDGARHALSTARTSPSSIAPSRPICWIC